MKHEKISTVCNLVCVVVLLVALCMQFQPFWTCFDCNSHEDAEAEVSIAEYFWLPKHHDELTDDMTDYYRDLYGKDYRDANGKKFKFRPNEILPSVLPVFLCSVAGIILGVWLRKKFFVTVLPVIAGIAGVYGFTSIPALLIGKNSSTHLYVMIAVLVIGVIACAVSTTVSVRHIVKVRAQKRALKQAARAASAA